MAGLADTRVPWPLVASLSLPTAPSRAESLALRPLTEIVAEISRLAFFPLQLARIWQGFGISFFMQIIFAVTVLLVVMGQTSFFVVTTLLPQSLSSDSCILWIPKFMCV